MNETADFETCMRAPSPAPSFQAVPSFGILPAQNAQYIQFPPASSSIESFNSSSSLYSRPYTSMESTGSRAASWSSADDWARRRVGIEGVQRNLQQENVELTKQIFVWKAKFETLQSAYNLLLERIPSFSPEVALKKLNPDDYPLIDYWFKCQWVSSSGDRVTKITGKGENEEDDAIAEDPVEDLRSISPGPGAQRGQGRSRAGINVAMKYIQDEHGNVIDGHRAREIRMHARALFVGFALQGKQFMSWGDADAVSRKTFYAEMVSRFEELQYCDLDWKSEQIATDTFPGWKVTWLKKQKARDGAKRGRQQSTGEEPDPKRSKAIAVTSTLSAPSHEAQDEGLDSQVLTVPMVNIVPNTPIRQAATADLAFNMQRTTLHQSWDPSLLQPNTIRDFSINNPLANNVNSFAVGIPLPTGMTGPQFQQVLEPNSTQPIPEGSTMAANNHPQIPPPPQKRLRPGTTKMRPSKTSTTPRNLCALEWAILYPKGTAEEFSTYYDGLSAEAKEKYEKLSAQAKESAKTAD
ncbi:hypothetical protein HYPSUDRAFT_203235 [Hypholoma sublateritium FD-334 SS-4]|uniref:Uncharacterized protein n=1 Tax=Hypholoma sublateritium (strain FD-334 SS-4) TaxID=945553 RepID=A0A0D2NQI1_HYPSF|nr:hypothetical protein HYPSUDRAFT_203235 [Hypholoma sublateritium FD-334 SS-4]